jgi:hypothetical protein
MPMTLAVLLCCALAVPAALPGESPCGGPATESAPAAIARAEVAVALASERKSLWTVAVDALGRARVALDAGACDQAIREAEAALALARLGIGQLDYPPYQLP